MNVHYMTIIWVVALVLEGCIAPFEVRANTRLQELREISSQIPKLEESDLLTTQEGIARSHIPQCATVHVYKLYGTNALTLEEVIVSYREPLVDTGWLLRNFDKTGAGLLKDGVYLEVSDLYRWEPSLNEIVQHSRARYKTLYWVTLNAFVLPDVSPDDCT